MAIIKIPQPDKEKVRAAINKVADETVARNVANAKWTIMHEGKLLPVTDLFGMDGRDVTNPMHAFQCVVYNKDGTDPKGKWIWMTCTPGEIAPRRFP